MNGKLWCCMCSSLTAICSFSESLAESLTKSQLFSQWSDTQMELDIVKLLQYFWFCDQLLPLSHVMVVPFVGLLTGFRLLGLVFSMWHLFM